MSHQRNTSYNYEEVECTFSRTAQIRKTKKKMWMRVYTSQNSHRLPGGGSGCVNAATNWEPYLAAEIFTYLNTQKFPQLVI